MNINSKNRYFCLDDETLVRHIQAGKSSRQVAASVLLERHRMILLRRCRSRLGNVADAEDALQETLLRAFRGIGQFKGEAAFKTWLFTIADNQCNTLIFQRARHQLSTHERSLIAIHEQSKPFSRPSALETAAGVRDILSDIPERDRDVLTLRFYADLNVEEIAKTLGLKLSAAKMRLYRAQERFERSYRHLCLSQVA